MWINTRFLMERLGDDTECVAELLSIFLTEYQRLIGLLQQTTQAGQPVQPIGHNIKGMCRDVGADTLADWAAVIEAGEDTQGTASQQLIMALPTLQQEVNQTLSQLTH